MRRSALTLWRMVFGLGAVLLLAGGASVAVPKGILTLEPRPAPPLVLSDLDGRSFDLSRSRGTWVLVHFWAGWCGPCRREMPTVQRMTQALADLPVTVVLVNTAEDEDTVFSFLAAAAPQLNTLMDTDGAVTERWQPRGLPSTFFVDPHGRLRYVALGGRTWDSPEYLMFLRSLVSADTVRQPG